MFHRYVSFFYNKLWLIITIFVFIILATVKYVKFEEDKDKLGMYFICYLWWTYSILNPSQNVYELFFLYASELTVARLQAANNVLQQNLLEKARLRGSQEDNDIVVIYNRVPKTASTSFVNVAYDLCKRNSFNVLHLNITKNSHLLSLSDQVWLFYIPLVFSFSIYLYIYTHTPLLSFFLSANRGKLLVDFVWMS